MAHFTCDAFKAPPGCSMYQFFTPLDSWTTSCCVSMPHFLFVYQLINGLFLLCAITNPSTFHSIFHKINS